MLLTQAYRLIPPSRRLRGMVVIFWLTVGAVLDFFSLATFIPVLLLIVDPKRSGAEWIRDFSATFSLSSPTQLAVGFTLLALLSMLIKTVVQAWIVRQKTSYAYAVANDLADSALTRYLAASYEQFTNSDYTQEMNRISNFPLTFANNIIIPLGTLISEGLLALALLAGVAIYSLPVVLLLVLILIPIAWVYRLKRKKIRSMSEQIKVVYPRVLKYTLQAVEAQPEIKAYNKDSYFKKRFSETYRQLTATFSADHATHAGMSRITELVAACCIGAIVIYALLYQQSGQDIILLLSVYAGISFRVIPSANRIFAGVLQIKSHDYIIGELEKMAAPVEQSFKSEGNAVSFRESLEFRNLSFGYDGVKPVLSNVTLRIRKGEKVILLGKSGNGKTTLLLILMRFLKEQSGDLVVDGKVLTDADTPGWRKLLGYVPQSPYILDATISENIAFGIPAGQIDLQKIEQLVRALALEPWINSLDQRLDAIIGEKGLKISGGQRQRLAIARALYHNAEILLLDEITNQLDRETEREVVQILDTLTLQGKTIEFITHRPELWRSVETMYEITEGALVKVAVNEQPIRGSSR